MTAKKIAEDLGISRERVGVIIRDHVYMRKLSAKWVPKCLHADQKRARVLASRDVVSRFEQEGNKFVERLTTEDETWIYLYDPETKEESKEWRHSGSPRPNDSCSKIKCKGSCQCFLG